MSDKARLNTRKHSFSGGNHVRSGVKRSSYSLLDLSENEPQSEDNEKEAAAVVEEDEEGERSFFGEEADNTTSRKINQLLSAPDLAVKFLKNSNIPAWFMDHMADVEIDPSDGTQKIVNPLKKRNALSHVTTGDV